ncbi:serine hydrolase domain-containing protein [Allopontixanthobacter sp.]|uniref:serine hydrolase domain-containing protein n=1 Tax=Allopontixanthobacter sp. TaxID=2906452 RepID=UPI002ABB2DCD|nr:serine hydrolase domain-containing protein [Allopontixanthobacter sp.]MDZ4306823.1 serine hydrolase domain-containing protein [Allopontixanthobacter sp.]
MRAWSIGLTAAALLASGCMASQNAVVRDAPAASRSPAQGLTLDPARIDRTIDAMVANGRVAGASVIVWKDGREAHFAAAGMADREAGTPLTRDTLVQIFSMTKPVTGVALMTLWEQGKFGLDDPLSDHLPQFAALKVAERTGTSGAITLREPARPVTIRDVMRHTAGFTYGDGDRPADKVWQQLDPLSADNTLEEFGQLMPQVPLLYDPGEQWEYSAAVDVQALLVAHFSGMPLDEYVRQAIFAPLGMKDSSWTPPPDQLPRLAMIYESAEGGPLTPMDRELWLQANFRGKPMRMGGSGIVSTVDDYLRFARMLLGEGALGGTRILKPSTVRLMATDHLDPRMTKRGWLPGKGQVGFGLDFAVRIAPPASAEENAGAVGEFFWDGWPSMLFWVDHANDMAVVFAVQKVPFDMTLHHDIRDAVYGSSLFATGHTPH